LNISVNYFVIQTSRSKIGNDNATLVLLLHEDIFWL
jgi:hypothetical protein